MKAPHERWSNRSFATGAKEKFSGVASQRAVVFGILVNGGLRCFVELAISNSVLLELHK
jgi:hypothetical protein